MFTSLFTTIWILSKFIFLCDTWFILSVTGSNHKLRSPESLSSNKSCFLDCDAGWSNDGIRDCKTYPTKYHKNPNILFCSLSIYIQYHFCSQPNAIDINDFGRLSHPNKGAGTGPVVARCWPQWANTDPVIWCLHTRACLYGCPNECIKTIMFSLKKTVWLHCVTRAPM